MFSEFVQKSLHKGEIQDLASTSVLPVLTLINFSAERVQAGLA